MLFYVMLAIFRMSTDFWNFPRLRPFFLLERAACI